MKRLFFVVLLSVIGMAAYSQQLRFTKGGVPPGIITTAASYEDFIGRGIEIVDENGATYSFIKADFKLTMKSGKTISLSLAKPMFPEAEIGNIARASEKGTVYTFTNVVVKDKTGKEFTIASVKYEFAGLRGN